VFLGYLAATGNVAEACKGAGIYRKMPYRYRRVSAPFAEAWNDAKATFGDAIEREIFRRAVEGYEEPVFYKGVEVATVRKHSDLLLMFLAKAERPEKFRESSPEHVVTPEELKTWSEEMMDLYLAGMTAPQVRAWRKEHEGQDQEGQATQPARGGDGTPPPGRTLH